MKHNNPSVVADRRAWIAVIVLAIVLTVTCGTAWGQAVQAREATSKEHLCLTYRDFVRTLNDHVPAQVARIKAIGELAEVSRHYSSGPLPDSNAVSDASTQLRSALSASYADTATVFAAARAIGVACGRDPRTGSPNHRFMTPND